MGKLTTKGKCFKPTHTCSKGAQVQPATPQKKISVPKPFCVASLTRDSADNLRDQNVLVLHWLTSRDLHKPRGFSNPITSSRSCGSAGGGGLGFRVENPKLGGLGQGRGRDVGMGPVGTYIAADISSDALPAKAWSADA